MGGMGGMALIPPGGLKGKGEREKGMKKGFLLMCFFFQVCN